MTSQKRASEIETRQSPYEFAAPENLLSGGRPLASLRKATIQSSAQQGPAFLSQVGFNLARSKVPHFESSWLQSRRPAIRDRTSRANSRLLFFLRVAVLSSAIDRIGSSQLWPRFGHAEICPEKFTERRSSGASKIARKPPIGVVDEVGNRFGTTGTPDSINTYENKTIGTYDFECPTCPNPTWSGNRFIDYFSVLGISERTRSANAAAHLVVSNAADGLSETLGSSYSRYGVPRYRRIRYAW
jgi:hypothetical protein